MKTVTFKANMPCIIMGFDVPEDTWVSFKPKPAKYSDDPGAWESLDIRNLPKYVVEAMVNRLSEDIWTYWQKGQPDPEPEAAPEDAPVAEVPHE